MGVVCRRSPTVLAESFHPFPGAWRSSSSGQSAQSPVGQLFDTATVNAGADEPSRRGNEASESYMLDLRVFRAVCHHIACSSESTCNVFVTYITSATFDSKQLNDCYMLIYIGGWGVLGSIWIERDHIFFSCRLHCNRGANFPFLTRAVRTR